MIWRPAHLRFAAALGLVIVSAGVWLIAHGQAPAPAKAEGLKPLIEAPPEPELALLMGTLQTLTHKLALSADAGNAPLAAFYVHESLEQLRAIQREAPEYEKLPIAVLIDRLALPAYAALEKATSPPSAATRETLLAGLDRVVQTCNDCHAATQHSVIRITRGTEVIPFNQSFQPHTPP